MSIFGAIKDAILGHSHPAQAAPPTSPAAPQAAPQAQAQPQAAPQPTPQQPIDAAPILNRMVQQKGQTLDWRHSIVDLLKTINVDSGLESRRELADELGYTGDKTDTATMNMWLHARVMQRLEGEGFKTS